MATKPPNTAEIHEEFNNAFDDSSLNAFCFDYFRTVYDRFSQGMRKDDKITYLLDYCRRQPSDFKELLDAVREAYKISNHSRQELLPLIELLEGYIKHQQVVPLNVSAIEDADADSDDDPPLPDPKANIAFGITLRNKGYENFDLTIERWQGAYRVRVESPTGEADDEFTLSISKQEIEALLEDVTLKQDMAKVKAFGQQLFEAIFKREVWGRFTSSQEKSHDKAGLRIRLQVEAPELALLPWEFLYYRETNDFFSLSRQTPVIRFLPLPKKISSLKVQPPLRVLVAISNPPDSGLDADEEWCQLKSALERLEREGLVTLFRLEDVTWRGLADILQRQSFHIFHFIGHGEFNPADQDGALLLENEEGKTIYLTGEQLGLLLGDHQTLRLVLLNACEGALGSHTHLFSGVAQSLVQKGIPAVIAMLTVISDETAITLAEVFYRSLANGYPVEAALTIARKTLYTEYQTLEWGIPLLFMRATDGQLFDIAHPPANREVPPRPITPETTPAPPFVVPKAALLLIALTVTSALLLSLFAFWLPKTDSSTTEETSPSQNPLATAENPSPTATPQIEDGIQLLTVTIAIAPFTDCDENIPTQLQEALEEDWFYLKELGTAPTDREEARQAGEEQEAALVVWGYCEGGKLTTHFEILPPIRGAPQVYEPESLTLRDRPLNSNSTVVLDLAHALGSYLSRSYGKAEDEFASLMERTNLDNETQAEFYILRGNSLLFIREDNKSEALLQQAHKKLGDNRILHNLAVAKMNIGWAEAELEEATQLFSQTIDLEPSFALARVNRARINLWLGNSKYDQEVSPRHYSQAIIDCKKIQTNTFANQSVVAMAKICLIEVQHLHHYEKNEELELPQLDDLESEQLMTAYWSTPLFIKAAGYFELSKKHSTDRKRAKCLLQDYLNVSANDVFLSPDRDYRGYAQDMLKELADEEFSSCAS